MSSYTRASYRCASRQGIRQEDHMWHFVLLANILHTSVMGELMAKRLVSWWGHHVILWHWKFTRVMLQQMITGWPTHRTCRLQARTDRNMPVHVLGQNWTLTLETLVVSNPNTEPSKVWLQTIWREHEIQRFEISCMYDDSGKIVNYLTGPWKMW